ncbi:MAG TPA: lytic transglycosylase domain-containing protein [Pyrinomonadaceae bacterium]|nr:lytic transglycosylase domain-containing protein [Pyrinomonadaceae bacterium]
MAKSPVFLLLIVLSAVTAAGQTPAPLDNIDLNAFQIQTPPPTPPKPSPKLTTSRNYVYSPGPDALIHLTSWSANPSLGDFTTGNDTVDNLIVESGKRNSVDPLLLYAIMHQESSFKPRAMSFKGARGLMQLMPPTAARFGVRNIWDPQQNIEGGARYMRFLLDLFSGDVRLALAGYNAGEGAVLKYGYQIPPYSETQEYVRRIGRRYEVIRDPSAFAHANPLSPKQLTAAREKAPAPLTSYEPSVFAARLPDGRLQLVSQ